MRVLCALCSHCNPLSLPPSPPSPPSLPPSCPPLPSPPFLPPSLPPSLSLFRPENVTESCSDPGPSCLTTSRRRTELAKSRARSTWHRMENECSTCMSVWPNPSTDTCIHTTNYMHPGSCYLYSIVPSLHSPAFFLHSAFSTVQKKAGEWRLGTRLICIHFTALFCPPPSPLLPSPPLPSSSSSPSPPLPSSSSSPSPPLPSSSSSHISPQKDWNILQSFHHCLHTCTCNLCLLVFQVVGGRKGHSRWSIAVSQSYCSTPGLVSVP